MIEIISVPRINALGLKGPENNEILLKKINHKIIEIKNDDISEDEKKIFKFSNEYIKNNEKTLFVGGDHSITYPIGKAFLKNNKSDYFFVIFDAHPDCMPAMKEPTHEDYLTALIKSGLNPKNICLIGIRKLEPEEKKFIHKNKIRYLKPEEINKDTIDFLERKIKNKKVYISIDIDAIDPKYTPAVNYREENGINKRTFFKLLKRLLKLNIKTIDLVEFVPQNDKKNKSQKTIKKLIKLINNSL